MKIVPVILCGGSGTRLWPLSRESYPKQFIPLVDERTLLQSTLTRLKGIADLQPPIIICGEEHRFIVAEQLRQIEVTPSAIVLEPMGRNTAPAIAVAAHKLLQHEDVLMLVLPSDHLIKDLPGFQRAVSQAATVAASEHLVTFGVVPTHAETGYGYIKATSKDIAQGVFTVKEFIEKPNLTTAKKFLRAGGYYWNSGMFMFRASHYLQELGKHHKKIVSQTSMALEQATEDLDFLRLDQRAFLDCPSDSIDYAVMEQTDAAALVPMSVGWSDLGSWAALYEVAEKDNHGNAVHGDVMLQDTHQSFIHASDRLVATIGLKNIVVVEVKDAVLVAEREQVQDVKKIVEKLNQAKRDEVKGHPRVPRPWGDYESIDEGVRYQVKRITVKPGASLSLQMHHHRAEHWIVVKGTAKVTREDEVFLLTENQSTYIPLGTKHRLENPGNVPLELIEVQSGSYLGEDDIVRYEDYYGRDKS